MLCTLFAALILNQPTQTFLGSRTLKIRSPGHIRVHCMIATAAEEGEVRTLQVLSSGGGVAKVSRQRINILSSTQDIPTSPTYLLSEFGRDLRYTALPLNQKYVIAYYVPSDNAFSLGGTGQIVPAQSDEISLLSATITSQDRLTVGSSDAATTYRSFLAALPDKRDPSDFKAAVFQLPFVPGTPREKSDLPQTKPAFLRDFPEAVHTAQVAATLVPELQAWLLAELVDNRLFGSEPLYVNALRTAGRTATAFSMGGVPMVNATFSRNGVMVDEDRYLPKPHDVVQWIFECKSAFVRLELAELLMPHKLDERREVATLFRIDQWQLQVKIVQILEAFEHDKSHPLQFEIVDGGSVPTNLPACVLYWREKLGV